MHVIYREGQNVYYDNKISGSGHLSFHNFKREYEFTVQYILCSAACVGWQQKDAQPHMDVYLVGRNDYHCKQNAKIVDVRPSIESLW